MFWKKPKKDKEPKKLFNIPEQARNAFRVKPHEDEPVVLQFKEQSVPILDISSGGVAFMGKDFQLNQIYPIRFSLPGVADEIQGQLKILRMDDKGTCNARFMSLGKQAQEEIHLYVLERQKYEIRKKQII